MSHAIPAVAQEMLAEKQHVTEALCILTASSLAERCEGFEDGMGPNVSTAIHSIDRTNLPGVKAALDQDGVRARALAASRRPVARSHPVRSGIGCVMSSFGIVRIGSWVMEPFRPLTRPARS